MAQNRICICLPPEVYQKLIKEQANSTCRTFSEYIRRLLTRKATTIFYRNKSFDDFMAEVILLRKELQSIREKIPFSGADEERLFTLIRQIKLTIAQIADKCLRD